MSIWHEWLSTWLDQIEIPQPKQLPEDQFAVSLESGAQFVLENAVDQCLISLRIEISGYQQEVVAKALLEFCDPQRCQPFVLRLGHDGMSGFVVAISLSLSDQKPEDLLQAFEHLWDLRLKLLEL